MLELLEELDFSFFLLLSFSLSLLLSLDFPLSEPFSALELDELSELPEPPLASVEVAFVCLCFFALEFSLDVAESQPVRATAIIRSTDKMKAIPIRPRFFILNLEILPIIFSIPYVYFTYLISSKCVCRCVENIRTYLVVK